MTAWYKYLVSSRIYGWFLQHRFWVREVVAKAPLLSFATTLTLFLVWFVMPVYAALAPFWVLQVISGHSDETATAIAISMIFLLSAFFAPIAKRLFVSFYVDFFAAFLAVVWGTRSWADRNFSSAKDELRRWKKRHG